MQQGLRILLSATVTAGLTRVFSLWPSVVEQAVARLRRWVVYDVV